jgi:hypothetical protein
MVFLHAQKQKRPDPKIEPFMCNSWCPEAESNHRHEDFQSTALPTELSGLGILLAQEARIKPARPERVKPAAAILSSFSAIFMPVGYLLLGGT